MKAFLDELAQELVANHGANLQNVTVVLPSKRAALFLKKSLASSLKKTFWAPNTITMSDLVAEYCSDTILDKSSLSFELYEVYREFEKNPETFDQFYKWGETLISDYNEIDLYLLDAENVFKDLRNIQQLESWSVENYTKMQERYLGFWEKLAPLYRLFNNHLKQKGYSYTGAAYKKVATHLKLGVLENSNIESIYFCGLNAISPSEIAIIDAYRLSIPTYVRWDLDSYYVENEFHEAGKFYRELVGKDPKYAAEKIPRNLDTSNKKINLYNSPSNVGQAKIAAQILEENAPIISHSKCALILPDPALLVPVLEELPASLETANVTMGYPLDRTELFSLLNYILQLQDNIQKSQKSSVSFHFKPFLRLIKHPIIRQLYREEFETLDSEIRKKNWVFLGSKHLKGLEFFDQNDQIGQKWENVAIDATEVLLKVVEFVQSKLIPSQQEHKMTLEACIQLNEVLRKLKQQLLKYPYINHLTTFKRLLINSVRGHELAFFGEPVSGLQIMGLLEARSLDFENVIILSVNEGVLPKSSIDNSILPFDLKRYHQLPSTLERDAVIAYHFYRLIQRAKNVHLVTAPISDGFGPGEESRYLLQLKDELKNIEIETRTFSTPIGGMSSDLEIIKDELFFDRLEYYFSEQRGLSVSALNKFIRCPLDFYFTYVCGLREADEVEEEIEDSTMGDLVHQVLEDVYKPWVGTDLKIDSLKASLKTIPDLVTAQYKSKLNQKELRGNNYISKEIAVTQVQKVINGDIADLKEGNTIYLEGTESNLNSSLSFDLNGKPIDVFLTGAADRIDVFNGEVRVIDYKTGKVEKSSVPKLDLESPFTEKLSKSIQLAYYSYLYGKLHPEKPVSGWIFGIRNTINIQFKGLIKNGESYGNEFMESFESALINQLKLITDPNAPLTHNPKSKYCKVC